MTGEPERDGPSGDEEHRPKADGAGRERDDDGGSGGNGGDEPSRRSVRRTYDEIASHFAETRAHPWPEVTDFLEGRTGRLGVDVGCGNGRHAGPLAAAVDRVIGADASAELLRIARDRALEEGYADSFDAVGGDAARLPFRDGVADLAVYVATLHHLPSRSLRRASLSEVGRVLAPGGVALVSAWSTAHDRFDGDGDAAEGFDTTVDWTLPGGEVVPRFYHIYAPTEFDADLEASSLAVERSFVSSGNCYAVVSESG